MKRRFLPLFSAFLFLSPCTLGGGANAFCSAGRPAPAAIPGLHIEPLPKLFSRFDGAGIDLLLLSRTEYRSCAVFVMKDDSTRRCYRLYDFTKSLRIWHGQYYCVSGKVNSADKLYLVIESVKPDNKHEWSSNAPIPADGAGGRPMG